MLAIVITDSTGYSHFHPLPAENGCRFTLGRAAECDFSLPEEETLADYHCMLTLVDGYVYLQAYDSQYGIFCGSREVREEYMTNEREYALGSCRLMLTQTEDEPAPATVTRVAKLQPKSVTRVAKLQPKSVTQAPQQPTTPTVNRVAKLQPKTVTRVAKLQPKSV
ncbi:MAG: FHA domain-containing protein, partial [Akkermansia sp.]|nr:FHA domain-containing protein [Akkermansia sp.]